MTKPTSPETTGAASKVTNRSGRGWRSLRPLTRAIAPALAVLFAGSTFLFQSRTDGPWVTALLLLFLALPIGGFGVYLATVRRIDSLSAYTEISLVRRYLSGPWLSIAWNAVAGLALALTLPVRLIGFDPLDWALLALALPVFLLVWSLVRRGIAAEWRPYARVGRTLALASWACAFILSILQFGLTLAMGGISRYETVAAAIDAGRAAAPLAGDSAVGGALTVVGGLSNGLEAWLLGRLAEGGAGAEWLAALLAAGFALAFHVAVCRFIAAFLVPPPEYARILVPAEPSDAPPRVARGRIALAGAIGGIFFVLLVPLLVSAANDALLQRPGIREALERAEVRIERIGDVYVREGTIAEIERNTLAIAAERDDAIRSLAPVLDNGFDAMIANVDPFLDWYYSLTAEYARIFHLLAGDAENHLAAQLNEYLGAGEPFKEFQARIAAAETLDEQARQRLAAEVKKIIATNRVKPEAGAVTVATMDRELLMALPTQRGLTDIRARTGLGAGAGTAVGTLVATKIAGKLMAKGTLKFGATAIAKAVSGTAVGALGAVGGGAAAGAAIGSAVPILGTAAGALIGGIAGGLMVGAGVDYFALKLEAAFKRDEFRASIIEAIEAEQSEMKSLLVPRAL